MPWQPALRREMAPFGHSATITALFVRPSFADLQFLGWIPGFCSDATMGPDLF